MNLLNTIDFELTHLINSVLESISYEASSLQLPIRHQKLFVVDLPIASSEDAFYNGIPRLGELMLCLDEQAPRLDEQVPRLDEWMSRSDVWLLHSLTELRAEPICLEALISDEITEDVYDAWLLSIDDVPYEKRVFAPIIISGCSCNTLSASVPISDESPSKLPLPVVMKVLRFLGQFSHLAALKMCTNHCFQRDIVKAQAA